MPTPRIKAKFPSLGSAVDIIILFQAIGFDNDESILRRIVAIDDSEASAKENTEFMPILRATFQVKRCPSALDAKKYLGKTFNCYS